MIYRILTAFLGVLLYAGVAHAQIPAGCTVATTSAIGCVKPDGTTITISGTTGAITAVGAAASSIGVGTTTISGGTSTQLLYVNGTTLGNETLAAACTAATTSVYGCVKVNGTTITINGGIIADQIVIGTTTVNGGTTNNLLYNNGGVVGNLATANNEVLGTNGSGIPAWTTTLPSAVTASSLTSVGTLTSLTISGNLTTNVTGGGTVCLQASNAGVVSGTGSACGSGGGSGITGITVGTTTISGGAANGLLYQNVSGSTVNEVTTANNEVLGTNGSGVPGYTTTLPSAVTASSLTSVGTIGTGTWQGTAIGATYGGTGINNGSNTLTLGNALTFASLTAANDLLYVSSSGNVGQEAFSSACTNATTSTSGCVKVDGSTITISAGVISASGGAVGPGLTTAVGTQNTTTNNCTVNTPCYGQLWPVSASSSCTVNSNCNGSVSNETGEFLIATGASVTFTLPNPSGSTEGNSYSFGSDGTHGFSLTTAGGTKYFYGCTASGPIGSATTTMTVAADIDVTVVDNGTNYKCSEYAGGTGAVTSVSNSDGSVVVSPTTGAVIVSASNLTKAINTIIGVRSLGGI